MNDSIVSAVAMLQGHDEKTSLAQAEIDRLCGHKLFRKSQLLQRLLGFLVDAELHQRPVTESRLAQAVFGLAEDEFHPYTNSHVRVNTSLLRKRLSAYYRETAPGRIRLHLPLGSFRLRIDVIDPSQERWRRTFGQAKLLATSRYVDELELALERIDEVIAEQPAFAPAFALKSHIHLVMGSHGASPLDQVTPARQAAGRAMLLAPDGWESLAAAASVAGLLDWDWLKAEEIYHRAAAVPGNELLADPWYQATQVAMDRVDAGLSQMRQALLDYPMPPRSLQQNHGTSLHLARRWEEAEIELSETTKIYPDDYSAWLWLAMQAIALGKHASAATALIRAAVVTRGRMPGTVIQSARDFLLTGNLQSPEAHAGGAGEVSKLIAYAAMKRPAPAIAALQRMVEARNAIAVIFLRSPMQDYLRDSPPFLALFDRMGIPRPRVI